MVLRSVLSQRLAIVAGCAVVLLVASGFSSCTGIGSSGFGPVFVNPQAMTLTCTSPTHTFTATQLNNAGTFTAVSADTTHVTVMPTIVPGEFVAANGTNANGSTTIVTVTGQGGMTGTTSVTATGCTCVRHRDMWGAK
jgi:hypothetical protein